jgi:hypothetical protein
MADFTSNDGIVVSLVMLFSASVCYGLLSNSHASYFLMRKHVYTWAKLTPHPPPTLFFSPCLYLAEL